MIVQSTPWGCCGLCVAENPQSRRSVRTCGSEAPARDLRMQPFGRELVGIVGRYARTTAGAGPDWLGGFSEGQVPR